MIFRNNLGPFVSHPTVFCPVSPYQLNALIGSAGCVLPGQAYALHWWNEIWRRAEIDKNGEFPPESLYEQLKTKYNSPEHG
jgi:hypothetical protein